MFTKHLYNHPWLQSLDGYLFAATESSVTALELEHVEKKLPVAFERDDKFFANIKKRDGIPISNRQMCVPIELRPGGSFQYINADGGDLGRGGAQFFDKAVLNCVFVSQNIEYTKLNQWSTDQARKAIISSVRRYTATAMDELRRNLDSQMMQPGTGQVGTITSFSTTGTVDTYNLQTDGFGARLVRYGQTIQVFDSTLATLKGSAVITFWDVENKQIKVTPAIATVANTDVLVVNGISSPTSFPAILGVPYHHNSASTGTWLGFSRSTTPEIRSNRVNASSSALSLPLPRIAINKIGNRVGIDENTRLTAWLHPCQAQAYEEIGQLVSIINKEPKEQSLNMYFNDNMQLAGAPCRRSFSWDKTRIDFVNDGVWGRAEILPIGFYTTDGRKVFEIRGASGGVATADIFYMVAGLQTFVNNPAATAYIDTLQVPSGY